MTIQIGGDNHKRPRLPSELERLFAAADLMVPDRGKIPIYQIDIALQGVEVTRRLYLKSVLRERGYIA